MPDGPLSFFPEVLGLFPAITPNAVLSAHPATNASFVLIQPAHTMNSQGAKMLSANSAVQPAVSKSRKPPVLLHHSCSSGVISSFMKPICSVPVSRNAATNNAVPQVRPCAKPCPQLRHVSTI